MASLSAHLLEDYEKTRPQRLVQSGAMEYDASAHGRQQQATPFSQFSQAGLTSAYGSDTSFPNASFNGNNMALARMDGPMPQLGTYQDFLALQQQREEAQALRTANQIATLQAKLNQKLGPEYISQRPGPAGGPKLTYAEGWKIINLANEVFGYNGWTSSVQRLETDFIDYSEATQRYNVGVTAIVRVSLRDGVWHEDVGYGMLENCKSKGMALDKCKKEAITDAVKRTLRNFGNVLGNCLYDKEYTKEILKMRVPPPKFNPQELHRRKEFVEAGAGPSNSGPSTSTGPQQAAQRPMAPPPPPPSRQPDIPRPNATSTSNPVHIAPSRPPVANATKPSTSFKVESPASTSTGPNPVTRSPTDESLYAMGSDDDALFAELSFDETEASTLDASTSFTDRSRRMPSNGSTFEAAPLKVASSAAASNRVINSNPVASSSSSKPSTSADEAANDRKRKIMAALMKSDPLSPEKSTLNPVIKPRTSSGGFDIPPGAVRPNRQGSSTTATGSSGIGGKRSSDGLDKVVAGLHGFGSGNGAIGTARSALAEIDAGNTKRPRLS